VTIRKFKILSGGDGGGKRSTETERLDRFLDLSDPNLIQSLRQDDERRRRWLLTLAALVLGLLAGGGGTWLFFRSSAGQLSTSSLKVREERAVMLVAQGRKFMRVKQFERAWAYLGLATEMAPGLVEAWDALGLAQFYGGQGAEAERSLRKCLEIDPEYRRAYHALGDFSFYAGDLKLAKEHWTKAGARRAVARLGLLENRLPEVAPLIRQLAREIPDDRYVQVMIQAVRIGQLTPELRLMLEPAYLISRNREAALGWRLYYTQRYEEASAAFNRALTQNPHDGSAMIGRGWCLLKIGTAREAQSLFEQALLTWPSNYSALNGLAWSRKAQGQAEGAVKLWERVLELPHIEQVEIPESLKGLGMVYYERGDSVRASSYLGQSFTINPYDPETEKLLNDSLRRLQTPARARL
jgi:tetratricopeptide (TPR) repeat protein